MPLLHVAPDPCVNFIDTLAVSVRSQKAKICAFLLETATITRRLPAPLKVSAMGAMVAFEPSAQVIGLTRTVCCACAGVASRKRNNILSHRHRIIEPPLPARCGPRSGAAGGCG